jgi:energy-coupling factor transporter ATP-binding protein EcfA2/energy-coupling factor transporter transmembrane protein EcfT
MPRPRGLPTFPLRLVALILLLGAVWAGSFQSWWVLLAVAAGLALWWIWAKVTVRPFLLRLAATLPVLLTASSFILLSRGLQQGWLPALELLVRVTLAIAVVYTFVATTGAAAILDGLRRLGVPPLFVAVLAFLCRYGAVFIDELQRMRRAREARTFHPNLLSEFRSLGWFAAMLFIRAYERSERVYGAMCARGWSADKGWPVPIPAEELQTTTSSVRDGQGNVAFSWPAPCNSVGPFLTLKSAQAECDEVGKMKPVVEVRDLTFHYPDGHLALRNVSFTVSDGEAIAIIGPNGAGKSTLLLHLNGILPGRRRYAHSHEPGTAAHRHGEEPHVWIDSIPVLEPNLAEVRQRIGLVFQDPDDQLFCPTVLDDVAFGPRNMGLSWEESIRMARAALAAVGLEGYDHRLPHHLSLGERKRVCLAGVLACQPRIVALDEPTSNLDPRARRQFLELLKNLPATRIVATHDLELVLELCSRVLLLDGGRLYADGPPEELLADQRLMEEHGLEVPLSLRLRAASGRQSL